MSSVARLARGKAIPTLYLAAGTRSPQVPPGVARSELNRLTTGVAQQLTACVLLLLAVVVPRAHHVCVREAAGNILPLACIGVAELLLRDTSSVIHIDFEAVLCLNKLQLSYGARSNASLPRPPARSPHTAWGGPGVHKLRTPGPLFFPFIFLTLIS